MTLSCRCRPAASGLGCPAPRRLWLGRPATSGELSASCGLRSGPEAALVHETSPGVCSCRHAVGKTTGPHPRRPSVSLSCVSHPATSGVRCPASRRLWLGRPATSGELSVSCGLRSGHSRQLVSARPPGAMRWVRPPAQVPGGVHVAELCLTPRDLRTQMHRVPQAVARAARDLRGIVGKLWLTLRDLRTVMPRVLESVFGTPRDIRRKAVSPRPVRCDHVTRAAQKC